MRYVGSFETSDPVLNRIWQTGAYTVHLCMQDDLWDAPKRDRGRWAGDIDVEGRVISTVFGDKALLERTLTALAPATGNAFVNGIPNYSALWITSLASLFAHSGDLDYLRSQHQALLRVLASMDGALNSQGVYAQGKEGWPFVDWSPGLYGNTPATILGTNLQFLRGYTAAAQLLETVSDTAAAAHARSNATRLRSQLAEELASHTLPAVGRSWQLNALGIQSGFFDTPSARSAAWSEALAHVKQDSPEDPVISPYVNATVLDAMARLGHAREAIDWIRTYWGGMLAEGATSFWEAYDLRWPKTNPHLSLQADGTTGFFVSMAHGWSAGPTAWLSEQVLGVRDPADGYRTVTLAPRLLGLEWARGTVPTPYGPISVSMRRQAGSEHLDLDLPSGIEQAPLSLPRPKPDTLVLLDGHPVPFSSNQQGDLALPSLAPGHHSVTFAPALP